MYLAYSSLRSPAELPTQPKRKRGQQHLRYRGYQAACHKYAQEIAEIQRYLPGWQPAFEI